VVSFHYLRKSIPKFRQCKMHYRPRHIKYDNCCRNAVIVLYYRLLNKLMFIYVELHKAYYIFRSSSLVTLVF